MGRKNRARPNVRKIKETISTGSLKVLDYAKPNNYRVSYSRDSSYTGGDIKCAKKHLKDDFVMWLHFYLKCPKIE